MSESVFTVEGEPLTKPSLVVISLFFFLVSPVMIVVIVMDLFDDGSDIGYDHPIVWYGMGSVYLWVACATAIGTYHAEIAATLNGIYLWLQSTVVGFFQSLSANLEAALLVLLVLSLCCFAVGLAASMDGDSDE